ncbi:MAG: tRNA (guanosine(37)-N1)-methyltransferase TrmD [Rhodoferax sp.]
MRFDVITLFPELFSPFLSAGVTRRAFDGGQVEVVLHDVRDHTTGAYRRVDDRPFGGGPGMVMMAEPLDCTLRHAQRQRAQPGPVVLFSPAGRRLDQAQVQRWANSDGAVLVCGRYEGLDQRWVDTAVDEHISLGDFVLSGGEVAAMALLDAVARLQPGVLGDAQSAEQDSFSPALDGLLDCPHYTRPEVWQNQSVPAVLLSGHHAQIAEWRRQQRLALSQRLRPDLVAQARARGALTASDEAFLQSII